MINLLQALYLATAVAIQSDFVVEPDFSSFAVRAATENCVVHDIDFAPLGRAKKSSAPSWDAQFNPHSPSNLTFLRL
jgi:hypothetical protein